MTIDLPRARGGRAPVRRWPTALALALAAAAGAASDEPALTPRDFAVGFAIEHDAVLPYFELEVPADAYHAAVDPALADLRVFDADGAIVRHVLLPPRAVEAPPAEQVLPRFPLTTPTAGTARATRIAIAADGRLVTVTAAPMAGDDEIVGWVIDAAAVRGHIDYLELDDAGDGAAVADFAIDGSHDLVDWTTLLPRASLVRLQHEGHVLRQARFEPGAGDYPFLRLRWLEPARAPTLTAVRAVLRSALASPTPLRVTLTGTVDPDDAAVLVYDAGGQYPVREVALRLVPNHVVEGRLEARAVPAQPWQSVLAGQWYALTADGLTLESRARPVVPAARRYWRFVGTGGAVTTANARLEIGWLPQRLRVLAEGRAPYTLAVGSGRAAARAAPPASAFLRDTERALVGGAVAGPVFDLGGEAQRAAPPVIVPWQRIVLWGVLVAGVLTVLIMVRRLLRDFER
ncbi:MAG: DUF3999 family protein [Gammaproteobacteria bacterium]